MSRHIRRGPTARGRHRRPVRPCTRCRSVRGRGCTPGKHAPRPTPLPDYSISSGTEGPRHPRSLRSSRTRSDPPREEKPRHVRQSRTDDGACLQACLYDGHCHPFLNVDGLRDGTHPLAARTCETPASDPGQADQTGSAGGCLKTGPADRSFRRTTRAGVSRIAGQAGPVPDPTPEPGRTLGSRAGSTIHILPAE